MDNPSSTRTSYRIKDPDEVVDLILFLAAWYVPGPLPGTSTWRTPLDLGFACNLTEVMRLLAGVRGSVLAVLDGDTGAAVLS
ncbi:MAG TPA: hypothetical protein VJ301_12340 [Propionibacteriaceae bacterium]|nr:hypothetical protein [Propionibacteriaceae bacterium]